MDFQYFQKFGNFNRKIREIEFTKKWNAGRPVGLVSNSSKKWT